jgi:SHS2 domain-containing protein
MYRWREHTGEVELAIESPSEEGVFEDALAALRELLGPRDGASASTVVLCRHVSLTAPDRPALLAAWVDELVFLSEDEGAVPERVERIDLSPNALEAEVLLRPGEPPSLVKGATYHRLAFEPAGERWHATLVLDV